MRKSGEALRKVGAIDPQSFGNRVADFLREAHPIKTALSVEADTGIPAKTVSKWLEGASAPSGAAYHRLIKVYGPELFVFVTPDSAPISLRDAAAAAREARLETKLSDMRRELSSLREARP